MTAAILLAIAGMSALLVSPVVHAQTQAAAETSAQRNFDVRQGALGAALLRFGEQSGLQFSFDSSLTRGKTTAGVRGRYSIEDGLRGLLAGTGLTFRFSGPRTVVIEPMPDTGDARVLGPLRIEGAASASGLAGAGVNGSSDPTATENSGTYAASATTFVSKIAQSKLDTAQSVSVVSRQQLSDQNANDLRSAMELAPGVTIIPGGVAGHSQDFEIISRGFEVQKIRIDGGSPIRIGGAFNIDGNFFRPNFDMALYDHIEVLRGADGMFSSYGNPGGVVNLVRKRPLDKNQVLAEFEVGSWEYSRAVIDATGPLGFDGRLRGRAVFTHTDRDYFYDVANDTASTVYGVLESDVTDDLVVRAGVSYSNKSGLPWLSGLPRFETGEDLGLPRSTCLCFIDTRFKTTTREYFLQADYTIAPDWSLAVNLGKSEQRNEEWGAASYGGVNPTTGRGFGQFLIWEGYDRHADKTNADVSVTGSYELFGRTQTVSFGGNYSKGQLNGWRWAALSYGTAAYFGEIPGIPAFDPNYGYVDVLNFDRNDHRYRSMTPRMSAFTDEGIEEYTGYVNLSTEITDKLTLNTGIRYSHFERHDQGTSYCTPSAPAVSCALWEQDENGVWQQVGSIPDGAPFPLSPYRERDVDDNFSWPPSVSLVYKLSERLSIYGSYTDTYVSNGTLVDEAKNTMPPTVGFNAELGANFLSEDGMMSGQASVYLIEQSDFPELLYRDDPWNTANDPLVCCHYVGDDRKSTSYGLDLEFNGNLLPNWQLSASYNYNRTEYQNRLYEYRAPTISRAPVHMMKLWTLYQLPKSDAWWSGVSIGGGVRAQTETYNSGSICNSYIYGTDPVSGGPTAECNGYVDFQFTQGFYAIYSVRLGYDLNDAWNVSLSAENLSDKTYYARINDPTGGNWYGEPRSYALVLRGKF